MSALKTVGEITTYTTSLGNADAQLQAQLATSGSVALAYVLAARHQAYTDATDSDIDDNRTLVASIRAVETAMPISLGAQLTPLCKSLDIYSIAQNAAKLRLAYKGTMDSVWTDAFRTLWRRSMNEEIIVKVASGTLATSAWVTNPTVKTWGLEWPLEVRVPAGVTISAAITVTITTTHLVGNNELVTVNIPIGATAGTVIKLTGLTSKFAGISSIAVGGGSATTDSFEVWISN